MKLTLLMAMTADGIVARDTTHFPDWTGKADKRMFRKITTKAGVIIMGAVTYKTLGKPLPNRLNVVMTRQPDQFSAEKNLIFTSASPQEILSDLTSRGYENAILIGGPTINTLFMKAGLIDELMITIVPALFGKGLTLFSESMAETLSLTGCHEVEPGYPVLTYNVIQPPESTDG